MPVFLKDKVNNIWRFLAILAVVLTWFGSVSFSQGKAPYQPAPAPWDAYERADFATAENYFIAQTEKDPSNYNAILERGRLALYKNDFTQAEIWLKKAIDKDSTDKTAARLLAENYYRQNRFKDAAKYYRMAGVDPKAETMEYFSDRTPYLMTNVPEVTYVEFVQTDPLPVVHLKVNGTDALFLIDTGGWELAVNEELALSVGAVKISEQTATYAGGMQAVTYQGYIDSVQIGNITMKNVPIVMKPDTDRIAKMMGLDIKGIIGTCFLYQFVFTLDYPHDRLILRPRQTKYQPAASDAISVPVRMAGDHFIVAGGKVNGHGPYLWFLDTGMAGGGFMARNWIVDEAGIKLPEESVEGMGGGGAVKTKRAIVDEVSIGDAVQQNIPSFFGVMPPLPRDRFGFQFAGIVSHGFLRPYAVTFDIDHMTVTLEKSES